MRAHLHCFTVSRIALLCVPDHRAIKGDVSVWGVARNADKISPWAPARLAAVFLGPTLVNLAKLGDFRC